MKGRNLLTARLTHLVAHGIGRVLPTATAGVGTRFVAATTASWA
jgi:hypothetical protein